MEWVSCPPQASRRHYSPAVGGLRQPKGRRLTKARILSLGVAASRGERGASVAVQLAGGGGSVRPGEAEGHWEKDADACRKSGLEGAHKERSVLSGTAPAWAHDGRPSGQQRVAREAERPQRQGAGGLPRDGKCFG